VTTEHIGPESRHSHQRLSGAGTPTHLALARYHTGLGIKLNGIHDKGTAPAVTALPSGETHVMFVSHPSVSAPIPSVRLRILAVTIAQPPSELPHL
jgi:tripartite-type tricarboxylate transporter receptor subunit TctC